MYLTCSKLGNLYRWPGWGRGEVLDASAKKAMKNVATRDDSNFFAQHNTVMQVTGRKVAWLSMKNRQTYDRLIRVSKSPRLSCIQLVHTYILRPFTLKIVFLFMLLVGYIKSMKAQNMQLNRLIYGLVINHVCLSIAWFFGSCFKCWLVI